MCTKNNVHYIMTYQNKIPTSLPQPKLMFGVLRFDETTSGTF